MKFARRAAVVVLLAIVLVALAAPHLAPYDYARQFRDAPSAPAGGAFLMGTDNLGRDRLSRLIYATRISIVLAPAAALVSILTALLMSSVAAFRTRFAGEALSGFTALCLSLPWLFLFITLRSILPLNTEPLPSILLTFALMGLSGWAWPARVFAAAIREMSQSAWMLQARASGIASWRIALVQVWPHLRSLALAQFRVLVPAYVLSEASLGLLGLGVSEPLPSWGNLLSELQRPDAVRTNPWVLAPLGLLMLVMICFELLAPTREVTA